MQQIQTQQRTNLKTNSTQFFGNFDRGSFGDDDETTSITNEPPLGFYPLNQQFSHLNKDTSVKSSIGAFCLFQPLGYCTKGPVMNGFCEFHIKAMNLTTKKNSYLICTENQKMIEYSSLTTFCQTPQMISKITQIPEVGCVWPFIEAENFDIDKLTLFNTPAFNMSDEMYSNHIHYMRMILQNPAEQIPEEVRIHRTNWCNYLSHKLNPKNIPVYCLTGSVQLIDVSQCTLITQAFLYLYQPQTNGVMSAPSSLIVQPEGFYLNFNSCVYGTTDNSKGSIMYAPIQDRPPVIVDQITTSINNKYEYRFKERN